MSNKNKVQAKYRSAVCWRTHGKQGWFHVFIKGNPWSIGRGPFPVSAWADARIRNIR